MNDNIIDIRNRLPQPDPDLIETLRTMLSEAQNGRLVNIAAVYITSEQSMGSTFHFDNTLEAIGAIEFLRAEALSFITE